MPQASPGELASGASETECAASLLNARCVLLKHRDQLGYAAIHQCGETIRRNTMLHDEKLLSVPGNVPKSEQTDSKFPKSVLRCTRAPVDLKTIRIAAKRVW